MKTAVEIFLDELLEKKVFINCANAGYNLGQCLEKALENEKHFIIKCCMETMKTLNTDNKILGVNSLNDYFEFIYKKTFNK
jgi:hypothetical protein